MTTNKKGFLFLHYSILLLEFRMSKPNVFSEDERSLLELHSWPNVFSEGERNLIELHVTYDDIKDVSLEDIDYEMEHRRLIKLGETFL